MANYDRMHVGDPLGIISMMRTIEVCRYCQSGQIDLVLDLGSQPPANAFVAAGDITAEKSYPLQLLHCRACGLVQLRHTVDPEELFGQYFYLSSTSAALRRHYAGLAADLTQRWSLRSGELVVDVGCNDGVLLREFGSGLSRVGVEPSQIAETAAAEGLEVVRAFFDGSVARTIRTRYGRARLITATNVFPHVDGIDEFTDAAAELLDPDGLFVIEASYLPDMIDDLLFDTIYHEHLCYISVSARSPFARRHGLEVVDAEREPLGASGPAIRITMAPVGRRRPSNAVTDTIRTEEAWGLHDPARYARFAREVRDVRDRLLAELEALRPAGVAAYGAPAKGNTLLNYLRLTPRDLLYVVDTNPLKQGLLTPGTHIPVVAEERLLADMPPVALLLTWNYLEHFLKNSEYIRAGGRFLVPLPRPRFAP